MVFLAACGMPRDPQHTSDRVREGTLRVGATDNPPFTLSHGREVRGVEADAVRELAAQLGARVEWTVGCMRFCSCR